MEVEDDGIEEERETRNARARFLRKRTAGKRFARLIAFHEA